MGMMKEVHPDIFRVKIPLADMPMGHINSYIYRGKGRNLIVDTGHDRPECLAVMASAIKKLGIDLGQTDFFITHFHSDHNGQVTLFATDRSKLYISRQDAAFIREWTGFEKMIRFSGTTGFPKEALRYYLENHNEWNLNFKETDDFYTVEDGETIQVGDETFQCILTPGHTMGHACLYSPKRKLLFAGDHILKDIIPTLPCWQDGEDLVKAYFESLQKVYPLNLEIILPGHGIPFTEHRPLVKKIYHYHSHRLEAILNKINGTPVGAYDIASQQKLGGVVNSWNDLPALHQWVATGETVAYLNYLHQRGRIERIATNGKVTFRRKPAGASRSCENVRCSGEAA